MTVAKLDRLETAVGVDYWFWCPGCKTNHRFTERNDGGRPTWQVNVSDPERPSATPSLHYPNPPRCHLTLTDGELHFCADCDHELAGKTVALEDRGD